MDEKIEAYWQEYLDAYPEDSPTREEHHEAGGFGDSPQMANELGALVANGTKTATCSALWEWQAEGYPLPEAGDKAAVLDGNNEPLCIIETIEVEVRPYNEIDSRFACEEGEGDRSLKYWKEAHWRFFSRTLPNIGRKPILNMPLVCGRFRVIYK